MAFRYCSADSHSLGSKMPSRHNVLEAHAQRISLPAGTYMVTFAQGGVTLELKADVVLGENGELDARLGVATRAENVDVNASAYPLDDEARYQLHIGATRAAHQLWIVTSGTPSPLLPRRLLDGEDA